jgi:hypothetical protein
MKGPTWLLGALLLFACGGDNKCETSCADGDGDDDPIDAPPSTDPPAAPAENDPAFALEGMRRYYLIGNAATPGHDALSLKVTPPAGVEHIDAWVGDQPVRRLTTAAGQHALDLDLTTLPAGDYSILLAADGADTAFAKIDFTRTAPYYIVVVTDWDFADPGTGPLTAMDKWHTDHPELVMTHFVGPYTFTDPAVSTERREAIVNWLLPTRDTKGDEIAMHLHPYCNFVTHAGVTCITDQSTVYPAGDTTGYTIKLAAYDRAQTATLVNHGNDLFEAAGLNRARTFRAGGWTSDLDNVAGLADAGFIADSDAFNWARLEEWRTYELYRWLMENWSDMDDTSQPYYPNTGNVQSSAAPTLPILEVPANGLMVDYTEPFELEYLYEANGGEGALSAPRTLSMGYHPSSPVRNSDLVRVDGFLDLVDQHLASRDLGPAVYITLEDVVAAYPQTP